MRITNMVITKAKPIQDQIKEAIENLKREKNVQRQWDAVNKLSP